MPLSAALQFSGKNSIIWFSQSSCSFVSLDRKEHSRRVGASFYIPWSRLFLVASSVPHYEDAHFYTLGKRVSTSGLLDTVENGILNTRTRTHSAPLLQEGIAKKALENMAAEVLVLDGSEARLCFVQDNREPCKSSVLLENSHSQSNKGNVPQREKRQLSEETKERIRARTREAMRDPKIRERMRKMKEGSTQSSETKLKIKSGVMKFWNLRNKARKMQESCGREWEELIADAARRGSDGDFVYQWDSYDVILRALRNARREVAKKSSDHRNARREAAKKSSDHRKNISNAIRAKWADPNYRKNVCNGRSAYFSNRGAVRKRHTSRMTSSNELSDDALSCDDEAGMVMTLEECMPNIHFNPIKRLAQSYKDPLTQHKLEKLKQMRASRLFVERKNFTERAWVLLEEAKRAADALEAAAVKDKSALAPLIETRRLLAEAALSLEIAGLGTDGKFFYIRD